jgi:hypothetical protein
MLSHIWYDIVIHVYHKGHFQRKNHILLQKVYDSMHIFCFEEPLHQFFEDDDLLQARDIRYGSRKMDQIEFTQWKGSTFFGSFYITFCGKYVYRNFITFCAELYQRYVTTKYNFMYNLGTNCFPIKDRWYKQKNRCLDWYIFFDTFSL